MRKIKDNKKYQLVTESGKILLGGETYSRRGAENWWNEFDGIYKDEAGTEERIYIQEYTELILK